MKRSQINSIIREMEELIKENGFHLPPFCNWTPKDWENKGHEYDEIRDNMLGWDIYAEKLLFLRDDMMAPMHFHWFKSEDIINRGGGTLLIKVYNDDGKGGLADSDVLINSDGRSYYVKAGSLVKLLPGESITIWPHQYHEFHVEPGSGSVLIGEVSQCNDDNIDNRFYEDIGRFPKIEEDEEPYRLLCNEYPVAKD